MLQIVKDQIAKYRINRNRKRQERVYASIMDGAKLEYHTEELDESPFIEIVNGFMGQIDRFRLVTPKQKPEEVYDKKKLGILRHVWEGADELDIASIRHSYTWVLRPFDIQLTGRVSLSLPNGDTIYLDSRSDVSDDPDLIALGMKVDYESMDPLNPQVPNIRLAVFNPYTDHSIRFPFSLDVHGAETKQLKESANAYKHHFPDKVDTLKRLSIDDIFYEMRHQQIPRLASEYLGEFGGKIIDDGMGRRSTDFLD